MEYIEKLRRQIEPDDPSGVRFINFLIILFSSLAVGVFVFMIVVVLTYSLS